MSLPKNISLALKNYPAPKANPLILDRAIKMALQPKFNLVPLLMGGLVGFSMFGIALLRIIESYSTGVSALFSYVSLPLTIVGTSLATLLSLFMQYGDFMIVGTLFFMGIEVLSNQKLLRFKLNETY
ncbi:MAG: hypothetical protein UT55_C0009G0012 [Candidatus Peregrinibacteria bacterium GW2011_GWE2_39_6]|nr:MAG: hypothetical protein UT36_C0014G0012 [Candidatus Peregrinibacteria bacterium GW2011_GWF2_39_17]KKR26380.1 MAG: hypothetical protein UT55_C0009G0012 [Candidatus Peregrinibacteria bacterium GW2011_GWE2_39_6]HCW32528.1 hypothetical protein [Candidatus Peregrinibacteria bacterium]